MKERYNVEISDISLTILSDEPEEFVTATVDKINARVNDLIVRNKRCSKLDAALLCALDYCGEYQKAERRIRNLEAQFSLYDANLKRLREELAAKGDAPESVKSALGVANDAKPESAPERRGAHEKRDDARKPTKEEQKIAEADTVNMLDGMPEAESAAEPTAPAAPAEPAAAPAEAKPDGEMSASAKSKLEQIEMLLRKSNE